MYRLDCKILAVLIIFTFATAQTYVDSDLFETFVIDAHKNAVWHNEKGMYYMSREHVYAAAEEFKLAIRLASNNASTAIYFNNLGEAYIKLFKFNLAIECFQKAIEINPNLLLSYENLVKAYKEKDILKAAVDKYVDIARKDPASSQTWLILGLLYKELDHKEFAIKSLEEFIRLEPGLYITKSVERVVEDLRKEQKR